MRSWLGSVWHQLSAVAVPLRYAVVGGVAAGALGGVVGLVIGLAVNPPTAWFAVLEIGVPAALLGLVLGLVVGLLTSLASRHRR